MGVPLGSMSGCSPDYMQQQHTYIYTYTYTHKNRYQTYDQIGYEGIRIPTHTHKHTQTYTKYMLQMGHGCSPWFHCKRSFHIYLFCTVAQA